MSHDHPAVRAKYLYIETFGCQMNVSDSEKIVALLKGVGYEPTRDSARADLILFNTCSVRAKAEQKVYQHLAKFKGAKNGDRRVLIGVGGCVAQQEGERLLEKVPHLDLVFGTHNLHRLPEMVRAAEEGGRLAEVDFIANETRRDLFPIDDAPGGITRFVTIMQGCDNFCSYCVVPYVRGREISRRAADVVAEITALAAKGVREVTLLGQNVNSYGLKEPGEPDFATLLRQLSAIEGLERIRFTTSHPKDISEPLIACFAELPKLCSHIHLPVQAGSDAILAAMKRGYTRSQYLDVVARLKAARPDLQITGDMIVGFPGETAEDFEETLSLMEEVRYADLFSFIYSPRPETTAAKLPDPVDRAEKQNRLERLQALQRAMTLERNQSLVGSCQHVLVEGMSKRGDQLSGRSSGNRTVNFAGAPSLIGTIVPVRIIRAYQNSLLGEML
ncbi:MAG TPA: tRNA (N6-isopentenyl adenosine(37)-C2)-methylthiotransferase MiaB [Geobacteraceae bacterium]